jgi:hypothetical protein
VESKTENNEEDVTDEITGASRSLGLPTKEPFAFPGLRSDIEAIDDDESRALPRRPVVRHTEEGIAKKPKENSEARSQMCNQDAIISVACNPIDNSRKR